MGPKDGICSVLRTAGAGLRDFELRRSGEVHGHVSSEGEGMDPEEAQRPTVSVRDRRKLKQDSEQTAPGREEEAGRKSEPQDASEAGSTESADDELSQARAEAESHLDDLRRLKAEFDNYRKRVLKEQTALAEAASGSMVARLLGVLDNFDLAIGAAEETQDFAKMLKGVEMVYGELKEVLRAEGLEPIEAKGKPFDPNQHEAALEIPGDDSGHLVVSEVLRPGYLFKGRVLRPAMVKVVQKQGS